MSYQKIPDARQKTLAAQSNLVESRSKTLGRELDAGRWRDTLIARS
jgi:hypothetical protein